MYESEIDLIHLQRQLVEYFDLGELKTLCFDLSMDYDELAGETKSDKARELVKAAYKNGRVPDVVQQCEEVRPNVVWNQPAGSYRQGELPDEWVEPLQRLYRLVKAFNRNRQQPFSDERTRQGDEIAFTMREAAPFVFNQFDVKTWLNSDSVGKRLAAVKFLDWQQDIEFLGNLLGKLVTERPFMQLHVLVTIDSLLDQLDDGQQATVRIALQAYRIVRRDPSLEFWRDRILSRLRVT